MFWPGFAWRGKTHVPASVPSLGAFSTSPCFASCRFGWRWRWCDFSVSDTKFTHGKTNMSTTTNVRKVPTPGLQESVLGAGLVELRMGYTIIPVLGEQHTPAGDIGLVPPFIRHYIQRLLQSINHAITASDFCDRCTLASALEGPRLGLGGLSNDREHTKILQAQVIQHRFMLPPRTLRIWRYSVQLRRSWTLRAARSRESSNKGALARMTLGSVLEAKAAIHLLPQHLKSG
jgi:hypothetical protein